MKKISKTVVFFPELHHPISSFILFNKFLWIMPSLEVGWKSDTQHLHTYNAREVKPVF